MKTLKLEDFKANTKEWFLEQLGNMSASQALQTISDLYDELHKPTYPKTYEECCGILGIDVSRDIEHSEHLPFYRDINQYDVDLLGCLRQFRKLLVCRDVYWKIAGEELNLGKPWKPDWDNNDTLKYCIIIESGIISKQNFRVIQFTLAFPTEEMRDTFDVNFENLIENCKELL